MPFPSLFIRALPPKVTVIHQLHRNSFATFQIVSNRGSHNCLSGVTTPSRCFTKVCTPCGTSRGRLCNSRDPRARITIVSLVMEPISVCRCFCIDPNPVVGDSYDDGSVTCAGSDDFAPHLATRCPPMLWWCTYSTFGDHFVNNH